MLGIKYSRFMWMTFIVVFLLYLIHHIPETYRFLAYGVLIGLVFAWTCFRLEEYLDERYVRRQ